jgi:ATP-dependent helicase HrpA
MAAPAQARVVADVVAQREALLYEGFVSAVGRRRLADLERYLRAIVVRLDKQPDAARRDRQNMEVVARVQRRYDELVDALPPSAAGDPDVVQIAWLIEELRVSLFAQSLGTDGPVSETRILRAIAALVP